MGQTLTHGVYLPSEGERNCYSGLASNWRLLDGAIGTVAAHTTAIAGKAPLVHTHSKADITDFPAYGSTAGTICEGNDSRLSDARTPVAHTHTKSDVTDLFNSENTWTANNTFTGTNRFSQHQIFQAGAYFYNSDSTAATSGLNLRNSKVTKGGTSDSGSQIIQFLDKDNKFLSQVTTAKILSGTTQLQFILGNIDSNNNSITGSITFSLAIDGTKQFLPGSNNTYNLGSSSYQWNNLYAKKVNTQSVNGINPGALSLPDVSSWVSIDTTNWDKTGADNSYTPTVNGWILLRLNNVAGNYLFIANSAYSMYSNATGAGASWFDCFMPAQANVPLIIKVKGTNLVVARLIKCQGNV